FKERQDGYQTDHITRPDSNSPAVVRTRVGGTQVEMGLEFNQTASPEEIPQADAVATTLEKAISDPNNNFNISVDVSSIQVI
ncbi:hypothetical protein KUCAC02_000828, partial [Chaenocephalus aceratus]